MITPYSLTDITCQPAEIDWTKDWIAYFRANRSVSCDDKGQIERWVTDQDGEIGGVYRHFVPYDWILSAISSTLEGKTRRGIVEKLEQWKHALEIESTEYDKRLATEKWSSRLNYDVWVERSIEAICEWRQNIYQGQGKGDGQGTRLDYPTSMTIGERQFDRVKQAANKLVELFPILAKKNQELKHPL